MKCGVFKNLNSSKIGHFSLLLIRALAAEIHENWIEATRYLNMDLLEEHKRELLRRLPRKPIMATTCE